MDDATRTMTIRPATLADAEAIAAVHVASWRESYTGLIAEAAFAARPLEVRVQLWRRMLAELDRPAVFVAIRSTGEVVGFACAGEQRTADLKDQGYDGEVQAIYVLQAAQKQGLGRALMAAAVRHLIDAGYGAASLWTLKQGAARGFYERLGAVLIDEREDRRDTWTTVDVAYGWRSLEELANA